MDQVEPGLDERTADLAILVDVQSAGQQVVPIEPCAEQTLGSELRAHRRNHRAREAQPVLEAAAILVLPRVGGGRKECVQQVSVRRMQLNELEAGRHCAPRGIGMVRHDARDVRARQRDRHPLSRRPGNGRWSDQRRFRYDALRAAMPELQAGHRAFRAHRLRNVRQPGDHAIVMGPKLRMKCAAAGAVGERDLGNDQPRTAGGAGAVVFDILPRRTAIGMRIHRTHRRLHDAIAERDAAEADCATERREQRQRTVGHQDANLGLT